MRKTRGGGGQLRPRASISCFQPEVLPLEDAKQEVRAKPLQKERSGLPRATTGISKTLPRKHKYGSHCDTKILPQP